MKEQSEGLPLLMSRGIASQSSRAVGLAIALMVVMLLARCGNDPMGTGGDGTVDFTIQGDTVVVLGGTAAWGVSIPVPSGAQLTWASSDAAVATVDASGVVSGKGVGTATITAQLTAPDLSKPVERIRTVTVVYGGVLLTAVPQLTGLGERVALETRGTDVTGAGREVVAATYSVADTGIVRVADGDTLVAAGNGQTVLTATYAGQTATLADTQTVVVQQVVATAGFTQAEVQVPSLGRAQALGPLLEVRDPEDSLVANPVATWNTSATDTVVVDPTSGEVTAVAVGSAVITATVDTVAATVRVRVVFSVGTVTAVDTTVQVPAAGTATLMSPTVEVRDTAGVVVEGVPVTFAVTAGGGSVGAATVATDSTGRAGTAWTVGTVAGDTNVVTATAGSKTAVFRAVPTAGTAATLDAPNGQTLGDTAGAVVTPVVEVTDPYGNVVAAAQVSFTVQAGNGQVPAPGRVVTDSAGRAQLAWTLGNQAGGVDSLEASIGGTSGTVDSLYFTAPVAPGQPDTLWVVGSQQFTPGVGSTVAPAVRVGDQHQNPIAGYAVVFDVQSGGGSVSPDTVATDATGTAATQWTVGTTVGAMTDTLVATATTGGVGGSPRRFVASPVAAAADTVFLATAPPASAPVGSPVTITAKLTDAFGNAVAGEAVAFAVTAGNGTVSNDTVVTDGSGQAAVTWTLGTAVGQNTLEVRKTGAKGSPVVVSITGGSLAADTLRATTGPSFTGEVGTTLVQSPTVVVLDAFGNPVAGDTVTFTVTAGGGSLGAGQVVSNTNGQAATTWTLGLVTGIDNNTLTASLADATVTGNPVTFTASGTATQADTVRAAVTAFVDTVANTVNPTVTVVDRFGNPVSGVTVAFAASGTGGVQPGSDTTTSVGQVTTAWTLGILSGEDQDTLVATVAGASVGQVQLVATVLPDVADTVRVQGPDSLVGVVNTVVQPAVRVVDRFGNGVPRDTVSFTVTAGGGSVASAQVVTDTTGVATAAWTLGTMAGVAVDTLVVSRTPVVTGSPATFVGTPRPGPADPTTSTVTVSAASVTAGDSVVVQLQAKDAFGNDLDGGGDSVAFYHGGGTSTGLIRATVDSASGVYTANFVGQVAGTATTVGAVLNGDTITTALPTVTVNTAIAARVTVIAGTGQTMPPGATVPVPPTVRVDDGFGNPIAGETVLFSVPSGSDLIVDSVQISDAQGQATLGKWVLGALAGSHQVQAAIAADTQVVVATAALPTLQNSFQLTDSLLGERPRSVAHDPITNRVYVANFGSNSVSVLDGTTRKSLAEIPVGNGPTDVDVNPTTQTGYVVNGTDGTLSVIDLATRTVTDTVSIGNTSCQFAGSQRRVSVNSSNNRVYALGASSPGGGVLTIDGATNTVIDTTGPGPGYTLYTNAASVAVNQANGHYYVIGTNCGLNTGWFLVFAENGMIIRSEVATQPVDVAVNPATGMVYWADRILNELHIYDDNADTLFSAKVPIGQSPTTISVDSVRNRVLVARGGVQTNHQLVEMDGTTFAVVASAVFPRLPTVQFAAVDALAVNTNNGEIVVAHEGKSVVSFLGGPSLSTTSQVIGQVAGAGGFYSNGALMTFDENTGNIYVRSGGTIVIRDPRTGSAVDAVPVEAGGLARDGVRNRVFATNTADSQLVVINTQTNEVAQSFPGFSFTPLAVSSDPSLDKVYVIQDGDPAGVTNLRSIVETIVSTGAQKVYSMYTSRMMAVDTLSHEVYVLEETDVLSIIDGANSNILFLLSPWRLEWAPGIVYSPRSALLFAPRDDDPGRMAVFDTASRTLLAPVSPMPRSAKAITIDEVHDVLYVRDAFGTTVVSVGLRAVSGSMLQGNPSAVVAAVNPVLRHLYVLDGNVVEVWSY